MAVKRIRDLYITVMYILSFIGIMITLTGDFDLLWVNLLMGSLWLFSFTVRNLFIYNSEGYFKYAPITYGAESILFLIITSMGGGNGGKVLLYITLADCYIQWGNPWGLIGAVLYFISIMVQHALNSSFALKDFLFIFGGEAPLFFLAVLIAFLVERVLKDSSLLEGSMKILEEREIKLKSAYNELSKAYKSLEEMSTIKERNRIAREIHDTVGHTLTTVIVEMEAGKMLAGKNITQAMEKYKSAQDQAIKGLDELRRSVRMLSEDEPDIDLKESLRAVVEECQNHAAVTIKSIIDIPREINPELSGIIIRALKEGLSNGIRHGGANAYLFRLVKEGECLRFLLQDNGSGCKSISQGFGLQNMRRVIEELGGNISFNTSPGEGFEIDMMLPLQKEHMEVPNV